MVVFTFFPKTHTHVHIMPLGTLPPPHLEYLSSFSSHWAYAGLSIVFHLSFRSQIKYHFLFLENVHWPSIPKVDQDTPVIFFYVSSIFLIPRTEQGCITDSLLLFESVKNSGTWGRSEQVEMWNFGGYGKVKYDSHSGKQFSTIYYTRNIRPGNPAPVVYTEDFLTQDH